MQTIIRLNPELCKGPMTPIQIQVMKEISKRSRERVLCGNGAVLNGHGVPVK